MRKGVSVEKGFFSSLPCSLTGFVFWFLSVCMILCFYKSVLAELNKHISTSTCLKIVLSTCFILFLLFEQLLKLWNSNTKFLTREQIPLVVMSKSQYFHISSLQAPESSAYKITESVFLLLAWYLLKVKLLLTLPIVGSRYLLLPYLGQAMFQWIDPWQIQTLVPADTFIEIILQRFVWAKGNLLVKKTNNIALDLNTGGHFLLHLLCFFVFLTSVGFIFSPLLTRLTIILTISVLLVRTRAACEVWLLYVKQVNTSYI